MDIGNTEILDRPLIIKMLETDLLETEEIDDEINENKEKLKTFYQI